MCPDNGIALADSSNAAGIAIVTRLEGPVLVPFIPLDPEVIDWLALPMRGARDAVLSAV